MQDSSIKIGNKQKKYIEKAVAIAAALLVWQIAAMNLKQVVLLPSPVVVLQTLLSLLVEKTFVTTVWFSFSHIVLGFVLGLLLGIILAMLSAGFHFVEVLLWPYMAAIKATPVASFIILCLVWLSSKNLSIFICFLMVLPVVYTNILNGIKNMDSQMEEMAQLYQISPVKKFFAITLPELKPYVLASFEISIGMAWKAGIAAEVIGIPAGSIGKMLYNAKIYLATPELFAWSVMVVVISVIFEKTAVFLVRFAYARLETLLWRICNNSKPAVQKVPGPVTIRHLNFSYGEEMIFHDFSFDAAPGEVISVMGPSGCGKTTLLRLLTGQKQEPYEAVSGIADQKIGMVFQENRLCEGFSAALNIELADSVSKEQIAKHLGEVGLADSFGKKVGELSGGMKRRTAIVRAILSESEILIFDEPCKGLDEKTKLQVLNYMKKYQNGRTFLMVTHDRTEAEYLGGKICLLK